MYRQSFLKLVQYRTWALLCTHDVSKKTIENTSSHYLSDEYVSKRYPDVRQAASCDLLSFAVRTLCTSHLNKVKRYAYGRQPFDLMMKSASEEDSELINKYFGKMETFCETLPHIFQINKDRTAARLRMIRAEIQLSERELLTVLRSFIPSKGFMRLDILSLIVQRSEVELYQILTENDDIRDDYSLQKDYETKEGSWFVYQNAWAKETEGFFKPGPGNKCFATAVALGKKILQLIPGFWVPWNELTERIGYRIPEKTTSYKSALIVTPEIEQANTFDGTLFVRKRPDVCIEGQALTQTFDDFNISADRVLKIAFAMPSHPVHPREAMGCIKEYFPEVFLWLEQVSAYSIQDLCKMFPALFKIGRADAVQSFLKEQFPDLNMRINSLLQNGECKSSFMKSLELGGIHLSSKMYKPSENFFQPTKTSL